MFEAIAGFPFHSQRILNSKISFREMFQDEEYYIKEPMSLHLNGYIPFAVHYEKIRIHLREMATNGAKIHSLAPIN